MFPSSRSVRSCCLLILAIAASLHAQQTYDVVIQGGRVIGATDKTATEVTDSPFEPEDLLYTIYTILGVDTTREYQTPIGRPSKIVNGGKMIPKLLA